MRILFNSYIYALSLFSLIAFSNCADTPAKTEAPKVVQKTVQNIYEKQGNIFITYDDGSEKQLTQINGDSDPFLLENENAVVCVRKKEDLPGGYSTHKIIRIDIATGKEKVLADTKPFKDDVTNSNEIINVVTPKLSEDQKYLFFIVEKYVNASQMIKMDVATGKWNELFSAESFELLNFDPYKGMFLAGQSDDLDRGRDIYYRILVEDGRVVKDLNTYEEAKAFLQNYGIKTTLETSF